ncbi:MAG: LysM peptidoglycan-binding domain-containing protein [Hyphomicrobiales bacterium]
MTDFNPDPYAGQGSITTGSISKPSQNQQRPQAMRSIYVQSGDTVNSLARTHNSTPSLIISANNLQAPYGLKLGQRLLVPGKRDVPTPHVATAPQPAPAPGALTTASIPKSRSATYRAQDDGLRRVDLPPPPSVGSSKNKDDIYYFHKVTQGDSLEAIAQKHKVDVNKLAKLNGVILGEALRPGSILRVPI